MFSFGEFIDLPLIWSGLLVIGTLVYTLLDGFDLGIGILSPYAKSDKERNTMINSIAPFWDGNETWIVLAGGGLLAAFPLAYSIVMTALYIPIFIMLFALIFRGVAFEFRIKAPESHKPRWTYAFHLGSITAALFQGIILGACVQGITVEGRDFAGGAMDWLTPFTLFTGISLVIGYVMMGASWLIMKTTGKLQERCFKIALRAGVGVLGAIVIASEWIPQLTTGVESCWYSLPYFYYLGPILFVLILAFSGLYISVQKKHEYAPLIYSGVLLALMVLGLVISIWPLITTGPTTLWKAAASDESLSLMLVGAVAALPVILGYIGYVYWVFRGKSSHELGYGD